jgi:rhamnosyltransferase
MNSASIVVPTLNPGPLSRDLIAALRDRPDSVDRVIIIDSGSEDGSIEAFRTAGFEVHGITRAEFDHGGTRNMGVALSRPADVVVFLTQDALPCGQDAVANIIAPFADPTVGLVYGRQLPRDQAGHIESHARYFNYPDRATSRAMPQAQSLGIKAIFNSNSFAAYRAQALEAVGGFPKQIIMGEDQVAAARMLLAGWHVVYQADATIKHSHGYSLIEEFRRYFDIGVFHDHQRDLLKHFGRAESEGRRFIRSEIGFLAARSPGRIPESLLRNVMKLAAYRLGQKHRGLPVALKRRLAMNAGYFKRREQSA